MNKVRIYAVLITLLMSAGWTLPSALAADWYVDNSVSSSGNGQSWATAWKNFSNIVWGAGGVSPGDTLYISGGTGSQTYTATANGMLNVGVSGTPSSPITIATGALSPSPSGHDGMVIFNGKGLYYALIYAVPPAQSGQTYPGYIVINGQKNGAINWEVTNCFRTSDSSQEEDAVVFSSGNAHDGNKLLYVQVDNVADGVKADSAYTFEMGHCLIYNLIGDHCLRITGGVNSALGNILVHDNSFTILADSTQGYSGPDGIQGTYGIDVYNNTFVGISASSLGVQHPDCIQWDFNLDRAWNNSFYGGESGINSAMFSNISGSGPAAISGFRFFNNIVADFSAQGVSLGWGPSTTSLDVVIANNTFVDNESYSNYSLSIQFGAAATGSVIVENNIFYNSGSSNYQVVIMQAETLAQESLMTFNYNEINAGSTGQTGMYWVSGGGWSGTQWSNGSSWTAITQSNGQTGAPSFASYTAMSQTNNYQLSSSDTACRGKGVNLTSLASTDAIALLASDIIGAARPATGAWDIGVYAFTGLVPPSGLKLVQ